MTVEDKPEDILLNLVSSIKNLRKNVVADTTSKKMMELAHRIKRTSYMAELEFKFCIALNCKGYPTHEGSPMFNVMLDYIELFYDKADVICDVMPYLRLFQYEDAMALKEKVRAKVENMENGQTATDVKLVRWKICLHKLCKVVGVYVALDKQDKVRLVNSIVQTYLNGLALLADSDSFTEIDAHNLEDLVIIAVELLNEVKQFDPSVLNPVNFLQISVLELALKKSPAHKTMTAWLLKLYSKLGMTSLVSELAKSISKVEHQNDYEKIGCIRFAQYTEFGADKELDQVCRQYKKHYELNFNENKNRVVQCFVQRDFDKINDIMTKNDTLKQSYFNVCCDIGLAYAAVYRHATNATNLHHVFNRGFQAVTDVCDEDTIFDMSKRDLDIKSFEVIRLGMSKEQIREEAFIEATYDKDQEKLRREKEREKRNKTEKRNIRVFGYKYPKVLKFVGQTMRCLKDCYEQKFEQLNIDMNYYLLLKNELSLSFLRKYENIISTVKSAIKVFASQEELTRKDLESQELVALEKIIKNQLQSKAGEEEEKKEGGAQQ